MTSKAEAPPLLIHVDVDSPLKLIDFYKLKGVTYSEKQLERFYETAWERALDFFRKHSMKATFFVVGDELETNLAIRNVVRRAHLDGHDIENHSYSHPFGFATLPDDVVVREVEKCSNIVESVTGRRPIGFRSPGYSINSRIINLLEDNGFRYDSSGFWSIMNVALKYGHKLLFKGGLKNEGFGQVTSKLPHRPYTPSRQDWIQPDVAARRFFELPLPRATPMGLPFYNNFNLWAPTGYSGLLSGTIWRPYIVYLFHIVEFMDLSDDIPAELGVHPNLKRSVDSKIHHSERILTSLTKRYSPTLTSSLSLFS